MAKKHTLNMAVWKKAYSSVDTATGAGGMVSVIFTRSLDETKEFGEVGVKAVERSYVDGIVSLYR